MPQEAVLHTRSYDHAAEVWQHGSLVFVRTPYNEEIVEALRSFDRSQWRDADKAWVFPATPRNVWSLQAMTDGSPFERYIESIPEWRRGLARFNSILGREVKMFVKQEEMVAWVLKKRQCIVAAEMRTGKTWAYIEIMESEPDYLWWFVAPKKVQAEVNNQLAAWGCKIKVRCFLHYSELAKAIEKCADADLPQGVIYDEGSKLKGHSGRSIACIKLATRMDAHFGEANTIRVLGTGTPEPHSYLDWWHLCEVVRPGFLPWGNMWAFQQFLEVREQLEGVQGQTFWHRVQWKDGSECVKCLGQGRTHQGLAPCEFCDATGRTVDNLSRLREILANIALIVYKKDVMELPDKEFVVYTGIGKPKDWKEQAKQGVTYIEDETLRPTPVLLNVAKAIAESPITKIEKQNKLAQLADGFQYQWDKKVVKGKAADGSEDKVIRKKLPTVRGKTPKDNLVKRLLAKHEEVGRFVIYAAYTEAIDHLCELAQEEGWKVIRCDGKAGWRTWDGRSPEDALRTFADKSFDERIVAIGHPMSMGYGLDLAASPGFLFYSINFDGEVYMQAIERGHSFNMDKKLGCTIYFIEVLPPDRLSRYNVQGKKSRQDISTAMILRCLRVYAEERSKVHGGVPDLGAKPRTRKRRS